MEPAGVAVLFEGGEGVGWRALTNVSVRSHPSLVLTNCAVQHGYAWSCDRYTVRILVERAG